MTGEEVIMLRGLVAWYRIASSSRDKKLGRLRSGLNRRPLFRSCCMRAFRRSVACRAALRECTSSALMPRALKVTLFSA